METWFWIVGWFLSILTMTGNGFIIFLVCSKRQLRTKTNAFVVSLAVADFCVGMSIVPLDFLCDITSGCKWPRAWLPWMHLIKWLFRYTSVTNLCSLVLDRYIAVVKPLKYLTFMTRRRVIQMIFFSWVFPLGFVILTCTAALLIHSNLKILDIIFSCLIMIFCELLACFILIFFVGSMVYLVFHHERAARTLAKQLRFNHCVLYKSHEKTTVKIMVTVIVVGLFLLCYGTLIRCSILVLADFRSQCNDKAYKILLLVLNSALNPLAYAVMKRDIKKESKRVYKVIFKKGNES